MAVAARANAKRTELAVALLERGFTDDHVEAAVNQCRTLDAALSWLAAIYKPQRAARRNSVAGIATPLRQSAKRMLGSPVQHSTKATKIDGPNRNASIKVAPGKTMLFNKKVVPCSICYEDTSPNQAVRFGCRHGWYCEKCVRLHAESCLRMGSSQMQCPECREPVQDHVLRQLLPKGVLDSMHVRSLEQAVAACSNLFACPTPDCSMRVAVEDGEEPRLDECPKCHRSSCLKCGAQPFHLGLSCQQHHAREAKKCNKGASKAEVGFWRWMEKTGTRQCPECKMAISKENLESQATQYRECHKMMCRNCNTKFCFKCLRILAEGVSCGCSIDAHGFVDPRSGKRVQHLVTVLKTGERKQNSHRVSSVRQQKNGDGSLRPKASSKSKTSKRHTAIISERCRKVKAIKLD